MAVWPNGRRPGNDRTNFTFGDGVQILRGTICGRLRRRTGVSDGTDAVHTTCRMPASPDPEVLDGATRDVESVAIRPRAAAGKGLIAEATASCAGSRLPRGPTAAILSGPPPGRALRQGGARTARSAGTMSCDRRHDRRALGANGKQDRDEPRGMLVTRRPAAAGLRGVLKRGKRRGGGGNRKRRGGAVGSRR